MLIRYDPHKLKLFECLINFDECKESDSNKFEKPLS